MKRSTLFQAIAGVVIASVGVWVFFRQVQVAEMVGEVRRTSLWKIIAVVLLNVTTLYFRSIRWNFILPGKNKRLTGKHFPIVIIGFMVNNLVPARIGEAVRAALLWKRDKFTIAECVGSLLVERLIDVLCFIAFLFLPIFLLPQLNKIQIYGVALAATFGSVVFGFFIYARFPITTRKIVKFFLNFIPLRLHHAIVKIGNELLSNLDWLFSFKQIASVFVLSVLTVTCHSMMLYVLGFDCKGFGHLTSMFGTAFAAVGAAIPLSPGYVGTLHASMLEGMTLAGVPAAKAGAIAILYHAIGYVTITAMGIYYFYKLKISFRDIKKAKTDIVTS